MTLVVPYDSREVRGFKPDLLLCVFASQLASARLSPFDVKVILEEEGFFEPGKSSIEEWAVAFYNDIERILCHAENALEELRGGQAASDSAPATLTSDNAPIADSEPSPLPPDASPYDELRRIWEAQQAMIRMLMKRGTLWKMAPTSVVTSMDEEIAKEYYAVIAAKELLALTHPEPQNIVANLDKVLARLARASRKSAHRPPSTKNAVRFRTAAVAAVECCRAAGASPRDSRQLVATCLNRAGLRRDRAGSLFKPKTIDNWSSKGEYEESLLKGMRVLWTAPRFAGVDRHRVAVFATWTAIEIGKLSQKKNS
jgi:hypothetical protein